MPAPLAPFVLRPYTVRCRKILPAPRREGERTYLRCRRRVLIRNPDDPHLCCQHRMTRLSSITLTSQVGDDRADPRGLAPGHPKGIPTKMARILPRRTVRPRAKALLLSRRKRMGHHSLVRELERVLETELMSYCLYLRQGKLACQSRTA